MLHIKIIVNEIIQANCKMLDFLFVNKHNSDKLLQLFLIHRPQSTKRSLITD